MALLTLKDIGKIYVSEGNATVGIRGVNLSFDKGEFVAITGKSGSGKSTLLNVISGMDSYEEGELYIEGEPTSHYMQKDWEEYRKQYISFIDPKGLMHIRPDDPKIEFYKTIKDLEARLAPTSSGKTIVLNSFIMSGTSPMQLSQRWNMERPAREAKNVYTLDSPDCVELMIDKILQY